MSAENKQTMRTIKKKFLAADKAGRVIKGAGGYVAAAVVGAFAKNVLESKNEDVDSENGGED